jgi:hypothetical protein
MTWAVEDRVKGLNLFQQCVLYDTGLPGGKTLNKTILKYGTVLQCLTGRDL